MKHPSNQQFFAYWNEKRGEGRAPDRGDFKPDAIRQLLGDIFVLANGARACGPPSRCPAGHQLGPGRMLGGRSPC